MVQCSSTSIAKKPNPNSLIMKKTHDQSVRMTMKTHLQSKAKCGKDFEEKILK